MSKMSPVPRIRMGFFGVVVVALFAVLTVRLYDLQVVRAEGYEVQAEANRVRLVQVHAPRGRILDRNGEVIVDNEITDMVAVDRSEYLELSRKEREDVVERLAAELSQRGHAITVEEIVARVNDQRYSTYAPVPILKDVDENLRIYFAERPETFPSVEVLRTTQRTYPYGPLASNILGYVGSVNDSELEDFENEAKPYNLNDTIGKAGIERQYESDLRGTPGFREVEVDAEGDPVRIIEEQLPQAGSDLYLTIDIDLQARAQQQLEAGLEFARGNTPAGKAQNRAERGAVVVEDPRNGQILAMASYPTYDPRDFVDGISQEQWAWLNDEANNFPLNNWAIQGQWAPGSTYKMFTAYAGLSGGVITPEMIYSDGGGYSVPGCTGHQGCFISNAGSALGAINLHSAIQRSSNAYFANVGGQFWLRRGELGDTAMQDWMRHLGLGQLTGIPLAYEQKGILASSAWQDEYCEAIGGCEGVAPWSTAHNARTGIGQGEVLVTPLQMANGYSIMANGGTRYRPQVVDRIDPPDGEPQDVGAEVMAEVPLPPEVREPIHNGLIAVTQAGTASRAFGGFPHDRFPVAGKTGTGEVEGKADNATFVAYGPAHDPQYTVAVILEESGWGGQFAGPVARAMFDALAGVEPLAPAPKVDGE